MTADGAATIRPDEETTDVVGARVGAQVVDTVVLFVQVVLVAALVGAVARPSGESGANGAIFLAVSSLPLYGAVLEGYWNGQTIGKRLLGIKVVDRRGREPGFGKAFARNIPAVVLFSWLVIVVALVAIATDDRRQRVFDQIAETYVVGTPARSGQPPAESGGNPFDGSGSRGSTGSRPRR